MPSENRFLLLNYGCHCKLAGLYSRLCFILIPPICVTQNLHGYRGKLHTPTLSSKALHAVHGMTPKTLDRYYNKKFLTGGTIEAIEGNSLTIFTL